MVKYAILSDIHANIEALEAVISDAIANEVSSGNFLCLGDLVGYGPNPKECIDSARNFFVVKGNHDDAISREINEDGNTNEQALATWLWTKSVLNFSEKKYLLELPILNVHLSGFFMVHGSPLKGGEISDYILHAEDAAIAMRSIKEREISLCFFGNTHIPILYHCNNCVVSPYSLDVHIPRPENSSQGIYLSDGYYLINPGSVGQPRNGFPEASYVIYDNSCRSVQFRFVKYDVKKTIKKIWKMDLDDGIRYRLIGRLVKSK